MPNADAVAICIVNWESTDLLRACLDSIRRCPPTLSYEIIVVDNASTDFDARVMASQYPNVRWIVNETNTGYAHANNQAVAASTEPYLLLLNSDTEVTDASVDVLAKFLDDHPRCAAVAPKIVYPDGRTQRSCRGFPTPSALFGDVFGIGPYRMPGFDHESEREVDQPMFSAIMIRRSVWEQLHGLDEQFPIFFNDVDWCMRAKEAGWEIWLTPTARVVHHHVMSTRRMGRDRIRESHDSLVRLYHKHYGSHLSGMKYEITILLIRFTGWVRWLIAGMRR